MRHKVEPTTFLAYATVLSLLFILMDIPTHISIGVATVAALFLSIKIKY
jgi:hypothetical protein